MEPETNAPEEIVETVESPVVETEQTVEENAPIEEQVEESVQE
jgi:hypothetical protein